MRRFALFLLTLQLLWADSPQIVSAEAERLENGEYAIYATIKHNDTSLDHRVVRWEILEEGRKVLAVRIVHDLKSAPYIKSEFIGLETDKERLFLRAFDPLHGYGESYELKLP